MNPSDNGTLLALGAAGLTFLQGAVLLQGFAHALNWW